MAIVDAANCKALWRVSMQFWWSCLDWEEWRSVELVKPIEGHDERKVYEWGGVK